MTKKQEKSSQTQSAAREKVDKLIAALGERTEIQAEIRKQQGILDTAVSAVARGSLLLESHDDRVKEIREQLNLLLDQLMEEEG